MIVPILIWSGVLCALLLGYAGHGTGRVDLAAVGAALGLPMLLYLAATPRFELWAIAVILTTFGSVIALWKGRRRLAVVLFSLFPAFLAAVIGLAVTS